MKMQVMESGSAMRKTRPQLLLFVGWAMFLPMTWTSEPRAQAGTCQLPTRANNANEQISPEWGQKTMCSVDTIIATIERILSAKTDMLQANDALKKMAASACPFTDLERLKGSHYFVRTVIASRGRQQYRFANTKVNVSLGFHAGGCIAPEFTYAKWRKTDDDRRW